MIVWALVLWSAVFVSWSGALDDFCQLVPTKNAPIIAAPQMPWTVADLNFMEEV